MTVDTRERFLRALAERLPAERVDELYLFPAIRQGGTESAVAVIGVRPAPPEAETASAETASAETASAETASAEAPPDVASPDVALAPDQPPPEVVDRDRLTVYRAHYRLILKGPERGTWEVGIIEEADAPPVTVGAVVRGVHERSGGGGDDEPERLGGDAFRAAVADEPWTAAR